MSLWGRLSARLPDPNDVNAHNHIPASAAGPRDIFVIYPTPARDKIHKRHKSGRPGTAGVPRHGTMEPVPREARFAAAMTAVVRRLPFGLSTVVAPSLLGYLLINLCTFFLDLSLLAAFHGGLKLPLPVAVTLSYGSASVTSYVLNRVLNFRSRAALGAQLPLFVAVSVSNYLIFVLGLTNGLAAAGIYYEFARTIAALCEAAYLYTMMRWVVFRDTRRPDPDVAAETASAAQTPRPGTPAKSATSDTSAAAATEIPAAPAPPPAPTAPDRR